MGEGGLNVTIKYENNANLLFLPSLDIFTNLKKNFAKVVDHPKILLTNAFLLITFSRSKAYLIVS